MADEEKVDREDETPVPVEPEETTQPDSDHTGGDEVELKYGLPIRKK